MLSIQAGFDPDEAPIVAQLYWQAFGAKLAKVLGPDARALKFLTRVVDPRFALVARDHTGRLLGVAGFKTDQGGLVAGGFGDLRAVYGWIGATWRALLLAPLERAVQPGVLQMDGICVDADARGLGAGTLLLDAIADQARQRGLTQVQLDVIDTNPRARALYERQGFIALRTEHTGPLRHVFGFASSTRMCLEVQP